MSDSSSGGHVINGRYQLSKQLGQGGMGSVWLAKDLTLGSPVAVKLIDGALAADEDLRARFYQEAKSAASLRSPHVVQIFDYGVADGTPYIAMELLEGVSLSERLATTPILPYAETARILMDVARAMKKAHDAGIVHRDMKPDNIFLVQNDEQEIAKVLDFGIAKSTAGGGAQKAATRTGTLMGTLPYMSPEQAQGTKTVDWRTDVWAMGAIAFECVCGRVPFTSDAMGELILQICAHPLPVPSDITSVPPGFDAWWKRASNRDPALRFQSAKELAEALSAVLVPASADAAAWARGSSSAGAEPRPAEGRAPAPVAAKTGVQVTTFGRSAVVTGVTAAPKRGPAGIVVAGLAVVAVAALGFGAWKMTTRNAPTPPPAAVAAAEAPARATPTPPSLASALPPPGPAVTPAETPPPPASATPTTSVRAAPPPPLATRPVTTSTPRGPNTPKPPTPPPPGPKTGGGDRLGF